MSEVIDLLFQKKMKIHSIETSSHSAMGQSNTLKSAIISTLLMSFLGSLPLGVINLNAFQITVSSGAGAAFLFALGALLPELIYVRILLAYQFKIHRNWSHFFSIIFIILLSPLHSI